MHATSTWLPAAAVEQERHTTAAHEISFPASAAAAHPRKVTALQPPPSITPASCCRGVSSCALVRQDVDAQRALWVIVVAEDNLGNLLN